MVRTVPPNEEARSVFERLGYAVSGDGPEFVAERKWRSVRVRTLCAEDAARPGALDAEYGLECLVTWTECVDELDDHLNEQAPDGEWAIIGVDDEGEYEVHRAA
ncbi:DUF7116 family protein [Halolamina sediminis]|jgi:hypothetical protein|uniref:DUF7116 family protein n=1 Tax=Halolamina sediminis TaxID=1480675 RepID=UPI0006B54601|nr:hypothetical protein [Halolamina sediminis]